MAARGDFIVHMAQVAQAHRGLKLIHLGVSAHGYHVVGPGDAEVAHKRQPVIQLRALRGDRPALDGVIDLRGVEAEHGCQAQSRRGHASPADAEGVRRVVDHLEAVPVRDGLDGVRVAQAAIDVHGQNGAGPLGNQALQQLWVQRVIALTNITEHGRKPLAHEGVRGGGKGEGRGDNLAQQGKPADVGPVQGLQKRLQRQVAVGEQREMPHIQIGFQAALQLKQLFAVVGQPVGIPQGADFLAKFLEIGHGGAGDVDAHSSSPSLVDGQPRRGASRRLRR